MYCSILIIFRDSLNINVALVMISKCKRGKEVKKVKTQHYILFSLLLG